VPPMYSAKKRQGKRLYELARKGIVVEREAVKIKLETHFIRYEYPYLDLRIVCSKGTYIRSLAYDLGMKLGCGAHLTQLKRTRSGQFFLEDCVSESELVSLCVNNLQAKFLNDNRKGDAGEANDAAKG
jgi:tRNA pseudouridine55 synthase